MIAWQWLIVAGILGLALGLALGFAMAVEYTARKEHDGR